MGNQVKQTIYYLSGIEEMVKEPVLNLLCDDERSGAKKRKNKDMIKYTHFLRYFSKRVWELFITVVLPFILKLLFHYPSIMQKS